MHSSKYLVYRVGENRNIIALKTVEATSEREAVEKVNDYLDDMNSGATRRGMRAQKVSKDCDDA